MLTYKTVKNEFIEKLDPVMRYLNDCKNARFDWTTSLPISSAHRAIRREAATACLKENMHSYYNADIHDSLLPLMVEYFTRKSIACSIDDINIRYSSFDVLRDFYASLDFDENDIMLICAPTFGYYLYQAAQYRIKTELIFAKQENNWKITPRDLENHLYNSRVRILLLTNPVNPTGVFYTKKELEELANVIRQFNIFVISDEIFSDIYFDHDEKPYSIAAMHGMYERSLTLSGLGKSRGIRLSFACSQVRHIDLLPVSGILKPIQIAAIEALKNNHENQSYLKSTLEEYKTRIECIQNQIKAMNCALNAHYNTSNILYVSTFIVPSSTNVFLISFPGMFGRYLQGKLINTSLDLAEYVYTTTGIAMVPGEGFFIEASKMVLRIPISIEANELLEGLTSIMKKLAL